MDGLGCLSCTLKESLVQNGDVIDKCEIQECANIKVDLNEAPILDTKTILDIAIAILVYLIFLLSIYFQKKFEYVESKKTPPSVNNKTVGTDHKQQDIITHADKKDLVESLDLHDEEEIENDLLKASKVYEDEKDEGVQEKHKSS